MSGQWVKVCNVEDVDEDDVIRFDHGEATFAIYRLSGGRFYATDGLCTHGKVHLAGGFVVGGIIQCPKHNGRFDLTSGKAKGAPACVDLKTYAVRLEGGAVLMEIAAHLRRFELPELLLSNLPVVRFDADATLLAAEIVSDVPD